MNFSPLEPLTDFPQAAFRVPTWFNLNTLLQVLGALLGLGGQYLINQHNPMGFVLWLGANAVLVWLQFRVRLFILVLLHVAYFALCVQGLFNWIR